MGFLRFLFRRTGFGLTAWPVAIYIFVFSIAMTIAITYTGAPWLLFLGLVPFGALVFGSWMNYTGKWK